MLPAKTFAQKTLTTVVMYFKTQKTLTTVVMYFKTQKTLTTVVMYFKQLTGQKLA